MNDVCLLLPVKNEEGAVGSVIAGFIDIGINNIVVVDGNSTDGTVQEANQYDVTLVSQSGSGKGEAVREGLEVIDDDIEYVVMADGDGTYRAEDVPLILEPLFNGEAEHVLGNRFAGMERGSMKRSNYVLNQGVNAAFRVLFGTKMCDILTGYHGFTRDAVERIGIESTGFELETEIAIKSIQNNITTQIVPITYCVRKGDTQSKLSIYDDGRDILLTLLSYRM